MSQQSCNSQAYIDIYFIEEAFKLLLYIGWREVTSQRREVIIDDEVSCIEFGIIYDEFYFIVRVSQRNKY